MHLKKLAILATSLSFLVTAADADTQYFNFRIDKKSPEVTGMFLVDGYSYAQMGRVISKYCGGAKVAQFSLVGKPRKKRGHVRQKFATSCSGGAKNAYKVNGALIEVEFITEGTYKNKHLVEITTRDGAGNLQFLKETIKP